MWQIKSQFGAASASFRSKMKCTGSSWSTFIVNSLAFMIHGFVIGKSILIFKRPVTEWTRYRQHIRLLVYVTNMNLQNLFLFETFETIGTSVA